MKQLYAIVVWVMLLSGSVSLRAYDVVSYPDSLRADSVSEPEWYVAPVIPASLRAPMRAQAAAASCNRVEAIQTFDIDSVLVEGTYYEYDDRGNVISTTVWAYAPDGTMTGKSKNEYAFDAAGTQTMTAVYVWESAANDWKGTEKYDYVYQMVAGEKKMISNTSYVWLNAAWVADHRYTYGYDEAGRETEYYEYNRKEESSELQPFKGHVQTWTNDLQTLDILYTAYANGQWTAGTKKEWAFEENGTQTMYATYLMSNGTWVGSSKETWTYGGPMGQLTLHEKYGWANTDWSKTLKEETEYAGANIIRVENYQWINGVMTGKKKEITTYTSGKKTEFVTYAWSNGAWTNATKETWAFNNSGNQILHEKFAGEGANWSKTLREENEYSGANLIRVENYTYANGVPTGTKKEEYTFNSSKKKTLSIVYLWENNDWIYATKSEADYQGANQTLDARYTWTNGAWVGTSKELWSFNVSNKRTLHEKYSWFDDDWVINLREINDYDVVGNTVLVENYSLTNNVWKGTKKEEYTFSGSTKTSTMTSVWDAGSNAFVYKTWSVNNTVDTPNEKCSYNWVNNAWVGTGTRTLTTKENGKEIEKINQNWPSGATDWVNRTCTTTVYSGANKTQEAYYSWLNNAWVGVKRTDYHFNAANKNDTTTAYTYSNNDWNRYSRIVNTFNSSGTNIMTHTAKWQNNAWVMVSIIRTDIIIEEGKQLLNAQWRCGADSIWVGVTKDTAAYSPTGKKLLEAHYTSWANNDWVPSYKIEHEYDEADREILNRRMDWVNNKWQGHYLYEYEYNDFGQQTSYTYYGDWNSNTNTWKGSSKYDYVYAPNGQYAQQVMYRWQNNQWVGLFQYFYTYDAANHEIEQLVQNYSNNDWKNSQLYIHEYRGSEVIKNNEYRWRNEQWQFIRRNEKIYDNDAQAKLRREITGSWDTNGVLISYTDNHYVYPCDPLTIRFVNYDGTLLETQTLDKGATPSYSGATPTREPDAENTYTFAGWAPAIVPVNGNATYTATFTATKNLYTITWLDEAGNEIDQTTVEYGTMPTHEDASKANTAEFLYEFTGWTPGIGIVTGDATYQATFKETKNNYTIKFLNYNGEVLQSTDIEYGKMPEYTGVIPTKPADDQYRYAFAGWDKEIAKVVGEETYTATFAPTSNEYTISWFNDDNTLIDQTTVAYGVVPTHADATKENTAEFTYTFSGWDHEPVAVVGNASYTATYAATKNSYTVTWLNEDGNVIESETLEYGATPAHANINKESTAEWTYTFAGWTPAIASVTGDAEYTATFTATKNSYTIIFKDEDGSVISSANVEYGAMPVEPTAPTKPADSENTYTFVGWTPTIAAVTGEATYTATYISTTNSYTITWKNEDGSIIESETLEYGATPAHADIYKESTAEWTYTFAGWTPAIASVTGNATYTAMFTATKNKYIITFKDEDGTVLQSEEVEYGVTPAVPTNPTKSNTAEYTYSFSGWDKAITSVTEATTYTATYISTTNSYTITWKNEDGSVMESETLAYGATPAHADINKESTAEYTYTFAGWTPAIASVTGDATYTATFTATKNKYIITFKDEDGTVLQSEEVEYGVTPAVPTNPTKSNTAEYTYSFSGWDKAITSVTGNATYTATYIATKNSYTITWKNEDGSVIASETLEYGATPAHADIYKESTAEWTYTFAGWTPAIASVTGDATYTATFTATKNKYLITFKDEDGTVLQSEEVEYGAMPIAPADPTKAATAEYTYAFAGWTPTIAAVTGNATYTATYTATEIIENRRFIITFYYENGETILDQVEVRYGEIPSTSLVPSKNSEEHYYYSFAGWTPEIVPATENASYVATYQAIPEQYTITFKDYNGRTLQKANVPYGEVPVYTGETPFKPKDQKYTYIFAGWSPEVSEVTGPATYTATFEGELNQYTIVFLDEDGSELDRQLVDYGVVPTPAVTPTKEDAEQTTYMFAGWNPRLTAVTRDATYRATYKAVNEAQGVGDVQSDDEHSTKLLRDGVIYILRGGKTYTLDGIEVNNF